MIVFDLVCRDDGHRFEGWFRSSEDFARQQQGGLLCCPQCGTDAVIKAPMAPAVPRKGNQMVTAPPQTRAHFREQPGQPSPNPAEPNRVTMSRSKLPPEAVQMMHALAQMQAEALKNSRWVGDSFAENARAMHYGEREVESIHGQATIEQAQELAEEGIEVAPLPFPVLNPGEAN